MISNPGLESGDGGPINSKFKALGVEGATEVGDILALWLPGDDWNRGDVGEVG